jgi:probable O-glycosylation ligase (exosortase A-associated)
MRDFAIVLIIFGSIPFTLVRPQIGILMWYWISLMNPHRLTWGYAYSFRVALVVAISTVLAWLISSERKTPPLTAPTVFLVALTIWVTLSTFFFAISPDTAFDKWIEIIKILGMTFICMCIVDTQDRVRQLLWVVAGSIGFYAVKGGIFGILTGGNSRVWGPEGSFIGDNNALALAMVMILPLLYFLLQSLKDKRMRLVMMAGMGLTVIAVLCTYSRGGFLALAITLMALLVKVKRRALVALFAIFVVGGTLIMLPQAWWDRMNSIGSYEKDASANERLTVWTFALRFAADHPVIGGGFDMINDTQTYFHYSPEADAVHNFHSIYFEMLGEFGYGGLFIFLGLIISTLAVAQKVVRLTRRSPEVFWARDLAQSLQVSIVGYCAAGAFLNLGFYDLFYALVALTVGLRVAVQKELAALPKGILSPGPDLVPARAARASLVGGGTYSDGFVGAGPGSGRT